ncbi:MAG: fibronectin type III domain-containing protein, partial [Bdellovibrionales bacterium]|nr:fibronectin type III domain-containing protein [Bdellovibrionales bacterium]
ENSEVYISYCVKPDGGETIPIKITKLKIDEITSTTAVVTWETDTFSTSQVESTDQFTGWIYTGALYPELVMHHRVELTGLTPNTVYSVRVFSGIEGDPSVSHPVAFRTRR